MRALALSVVAAGCLLIQMASAQAPVEAVERAKHYFNAGAQAYAVGQYQAAIQAFEQAYQLAPRPAVLFSIAQAERRQYFLDRKREHLERSVDLFRRYVEEQPQGGRKVDAVQALSELEPMISRLLPGTDVPAVPVQATSPPTRVMVSCASTGARLSLDGRPSTDSPLIAETSPGKHWVTISSRGYATEHRQLVALKGALVAVDVALKELPARLKILAPDGTILSIDGRLQGTAPFDQPLDLSAGSHIVTMTRSGFVGVSREIRLDRGETTVAQAVMARSTQHTVSHVLLGASASALTAGGVFAYFTYDRDRTARGFLDSRGRQEMAPETLDQYESARLDRDQFRRATWLALGVSAGLALSGLALYLLDAPSAPSSLKGPSKPGAAPNPTSRERTTSFSALPSWAPGGIGAVVTGQF